MRISLLKDGKEQVFTTVFIPAITFRKVLQFNKSMDFNELTPEQLDELVGLVVFTFNNQFTIDDLYNGLPANKLLSTVHELISTVVGEAGGQSSQAEEGNGPK